MSGAAYWDSQAATLEEADHAVWSVPAEEWDSTTEACVQTIDAWIDPEASRILDVGCGTGRLLRPIAERHPLAHVVGVDVSARMLVHARSRTKHLSNVRLRRSISSTDIGFWDPVGFAYSMCVLQHLDRETCAALIASVAVCLETGGRFLYQYVGDDLIHDDGHVPLTVGVGWATDAGLTIESWSQGGYSSDWMWVVARR